jgi:uncharacterized protein YjdB
MKKRILSSLTAFLMICSGISAQTYLGDINSDGKVNVGDFLMIMDVLLGQTEPTEVNTGLYYTVDNSFVAGTWYKSQNDSIVLNADGTTTFSGASTYEYFPFAHKLVFYGSGGNTVSEFNTALKGADLYMNSINSIQLETYYKTKNILVRYIKLDDAVEDIFIGDEREFIPTVIPANAVNKELTWTSSNDSIATVVDGVVKGIDVGTATITCVSTDGSDVQFSFDVNVTHGYVDLGLPSGTLWATCNIGASSPEDYGNYLAWADPVGSDEGKTRFYWTDYKYSEGEYNQLTKYNNDPSMGVVNDYLELELEDDAAYLKWGNGWRVPSNDQYQELKSKCSSTVTSINGVSGTMLTGPNGNTIFFPYTGFILDNSSMLIGTYGYYWARTRSQVYSGNAGLATFRDNGTTIAYTKSLCQGQTIRPVYIPNLVTGITLDKSAETILVGSEIQITATVSPSNATYRNVSWYSSDKSVVVVENGAVTGRKAGTVTVTCLAADGSSVQATCEITVE